MSANGHANGVDTWYRFKNWIGSFLSSQDGRRAMWLFVLLVAFLVGINGLNVINSYVGRDFISAIEHRDRTGFVRQAWLYIVVFALSTVAAVLYRYLEERLGLIWRTWQTQQIVDRYLRDQAYYRVEEYARLPNPDQRISEDIRTFTSTTLSFVLMTLNASFTIVAFSGVLWSISPLLFLVAVLYALIGSLLTILVGRRLIGLNVKQLDKEANFRSELMRVRDNAVPLALMHREGQIRDRLAQRFGEIVRNTRRIISVNRNLGFFTNGYNYLIQIIPALIVAPLFMRGDVAFGVVTQSAMAFSALMGAFSLAVTQFQSISSYAAVIGRLGSLIEAMGQGCEGTAAAIGVIEGGERLAFEHLTLRRADGRTLLQDLNVEFVPGSNVLITGAFGHAKLALFRATAGLSCDGEGRILRPDSNHILFVPELPYLPHGTLRDILLQGDVHDRSRDTEIAAVLETVGLWTVVEQLGGLDVEGEWHSVLGVSEQANLVVARVLLARPLFVFFDRMSVSMKRAQAERTLQALASAGITYLVLGKRDDAAGFFDRVLDISEDGHWTCRSLRTEVTA